MYGIYGNIYHQYIPNVSIYTIHGSYVYYILYYIFKWFLYLCHPWSLWSLWAQNVCMAKVLALAERVASSAHVDHLRPLELSWWRKPADGALKKPGGGKEVCHGTLLARFFVDIWMNFDDSEMVFLVLRYVWYEIWWSIGVVASGD